MVDIGAARALREDGRSLLPAGVISISGDFDKGEMVEIIDSGTGHPVARGLAEIGSEQLERMRKKAGKCDHKDVVVHRDNMALV